MNSNLLRFSAFSAVGLWAWKGQGFRWPDRPGSGRRPGYGRCPEGQADQIGADGRWLEGLGAVILAATRCDLGEDLAQAGLQGPGGTLAWAAGSIEAWRLPRFLSDWVLGLRRASGGVVSPR